MFDSFHWTLAQADPPPPAPDQTGTDTTTGTTEQPPGDGTATDSETPPGAADWTLPLLLLLMVVIFFVMTILPQRRERKRKDQMLAAMKKGDRVQTIGGVLGTVAEVREHEVVVKVDESNNTRLHFAKAAVQAVLDKENPKPGS